MLHSTDMMDFWGLGLWILWPLLGPGPVVWVKTEHQLSHSAPSQIQPALKPTAMAHAPFLAAISASVSVAPSPRREPHRGSHLFPICRQGLKSMEPRPPSTLFMFTPESDPVVRVLAGVSQVAKCHVSKSDTMRDAHEKDASTPHTMSAGSHGDKDLGTLKSQRQCTVTKTGRMLSRPALAWICSLHLPHMHKGEADAIARLYARDAAVEVAALRKAARQATYRTPFWFLTPSYSCPSTTF